MIAAARFSVHRTPSRTAVRPFVIVLQSDDFARTPTRVVAPLVRPECHAATPRRARARGAKTRGSAAGYVLNPCDLATLGVHRLGELVATFADDDDARRRIPDALDIVLKPF